MRAFSQNLALPRERARVFYAAGLEVLLRFKQAVDNFDHTKYSQRGLGLRIMHHPPYMARFQQIEKDLAYISDDFKNAIQKLLEQKIALYEMILQVFQRNDVVTAALIRRYVDKYPRHTSWLTAERAGRNDMRGEFGEDLESYRQNYRRAREHFNNRHTDLAVDKDRESAKIICVYMTKQRLEHITLHR